MRISARLAQKHVKAARQVPHQRNLHLSHVDNAEAAQAHEAEVRLEDLGAERREGGENQVREQQAAQPEDRPPNEPGSQILVVLHDLASFPVQIVPVLKCSTISAFQGVKNKNWRTFH